MARQVKTVVFEAPAAGDSVENPPAIPPMMDLKSDRPWAADITDPDARPDVETELQSVLSELGQGDDVGKVVVFRINKEFKKQEWVGRYSTPEFSALGVSGVARRFGPGDYVFYVYGSQSNKLVSRKTVSIAEDFQKTQGGEMNSDLATAMKEGFTQLATMMASALTAMTQQKAPTEEDVLKKIAMYKQIFSGGPAQPQKDPFDAMRAALEMVKELQPRKGGEAGLYDTAMKFIDKFAPAITDAIKNAPALAAPVQPVAAGQPVSQPQQPIAPPNGDNAMAFQQQMLALYFNLLIDSAQQDADPYTYANLILDKVPELLIAQWLAKENLVDELAKIDPRVNSFRNWFTRLHSAIIELRSQTDEDPDIDTDEGAQA